MAGGHRAERTECKSLETNGFSECSGQLGRVGVEEGGQL